MVDRLELTGMSFQGRHGVRPAEREQAQEFVVDVDVESDLADASRSDGIADTIDYRELRAIVRDVIEGPSMQLLEALAGRIADRVLTIPRVEAVSVRIAKRPASMLPIASAAVHINRTRA